MRQSDITKWKAAVAKSKQARILMADSLRACLDKTPAALVAAYYQRKDRSHAPAMLALIQYRLGFPADALLVAQGEALVDYGKHDPDECRKPLDKRNREAVLLDYCLKHCTPYAGA